MIYCCLLTMLWCFLSQQLPMRCVLACRADLLEALPADDLIDMQSVVLDALQHVTGKTLLAST